MKAVLEERNRELLRDIDDLLGYITLSDVPQELDPFKSAVRSVCERMRQTLEINLLKIQLLAHANLLDDIISETANALNKVRQMSEILIPALVRDPYGTHLSLKIVSWLHQAHSQTQHCAPVVTDGSWGIMPFALPVYYVPLLQQRRLLYQPLLFHEFGHQLYLHHKLELDELVKEFQYKVLKKITPAVGSNDPYHEQQMAYNQVVAFTWYKWIQELFCDAVGLRIGGASYLKAFSASLSMMRKSDFHIEQESLIGSSHPVTWLRVKFLTLQARSEGFDDLAENIDKLWKDLAAALVNFEDYYGVYDDRLQDEVIQVLEDMLVEADPRRCQVEECEPKDTSPDFSPVWLLNQAWHIYETQPVKYSEWERAAIDRYLHSQGLLPDILDKTTTIRSG